MAEKPKHWMQKATSSMSKGFLHRATNTPAGEKIPASKLATAARSKNPRVRRAVTLAHTFAAARRGK